MSIIQYCDLNTLKDFIECATGQQFKGKHIRCFAHADRNPSMSVYEKSGKGMLKCFSCDWSGDILDAYKHINGVSCDVEATKSLISGGHIAECDTLLQDKNSKRDPKAPPVSEQLKEVLGYQAHYKYIDNVGNLAFKVRKRVGGKKSFEWRHIDNATGSIKNGKGELGFSIYRLKQAQRGMSTALYIFEGEKDVDTAIKCGLNAIHIEDCSFTDAPNLLKNYKHIRILMDHDEAGSHKATRLSNILEESGLFTRSLKESKSKLIGFFEVGVYPFWFDKGHDLTDTLDMCVSNNGLKIFVEHIAFTDKHYNADQIVNLVGFDQSEDSISNIRKVRFRNVFAIPLTIEEAYRLLIKNFVKDSGERAVVKATCDVVKVKNNLKSLALLEAEKYTLKEAHKILDTFLNDTINFTNKDLSKRIIKTFILASYAKLQDDSLDAQMILAIVGKQRSGKSELVDVITGKSSSKVMNGIYTGHPPRIDSTIRGIDTQNKFFIRLEEYKSFSDTAIDTLKAFTSVRSKKLRRAYSKNDTESTIYGNIVITANNIEVLNDPTGNRRVFPVEIDSSSDDIVSENIQRSAVTRAMCSDTVMGCATRIILEEKFNQTFIHALKDSCAEHDARFSKSYIAELLVTNHTPKTAIAVNNRDFKYLMRQIITDYESKDLPTVKREAERELTESSNVLQTHIGSIIESLELNKEIYGFRSSVRLISRKDIEYIAKKVWVIPRIGLIEMYADPKELCKHLGSRFVKGSKIHMFLNDSHVPF